MYTGKTMEKSLNRIFLTALSILLLTVASYQPSFCSLTPLERRTPEQNKFYLAIDAVKKGELFRVQRFVQENPEFWLWVDKDGSTLTHKAAGYGKLNILNYLIDKDPQFRAIALVNNLGETPLDLAQLWKHKDIEQRIREVINIPEEPISETSGESSTSSESTSQVFQEPSTRPSVQSAQRSDTSRDVFFQAIAAIQRDKSDDFIRFLARDPRIITMQDDTGRTLLFVAAENGKAEIVDYLLSHYSLDPNISNESNLTPLAKAITKSSKADGREKQAYKAIIEMLQNKGGKILAQVYVIYEPSSFYQEEIGTFARSHIPSAYPQVNLVDENDLHITFAYFSVPMEYDASEGDNYLAKAFKIRQQILHIIKDLALERQLKNFEQTRPFTAQLAIKPLGSFLAFNVNVPRGYFQELERFYAAVLNDVEGSAKMYEETLPPHLSVAKLKPGISKETLFEEKFDSLAQLKERFAGKFRVAVRIPSAESPGYKEIR